MFGHNLTLVLRALWCLIAAGVAGEEVRIGVFGLFRPTLLTVAPFGSATLKVMSGASTFTLSGNSPHELRGRARVTGIDGGAGDFVLAVPGRIGRRYRGVLSIEVDSDVLAATIIMDREIAVASVIVAESPPGSGAEALKAQAVVSRSFYAAGERHRGYAFCDTTHCQFLREPPAVGSVFDKAARETAGLLLRYRGAPIEALYSANCGGRTKTLADAGLSPGAYPYVSVDCPCRGGSRGHGVGLCQDGAARLAAAGSSFREILRHYFPSAVVE